MIILSVIGEVYTVESRWSSLIRSYDHVMLQVLDLSVDLSAASAAKEE